MCVAVLTCGLSTLVDFMCVYFVCAMEVKALLVMPTLGLFDTVVATAISFICMCAHTHTHTHTEDIYLYVFFFQFYEQLNIQVLIFMR